MIRTKTLAILSIGICAFASCNSVRNNERLYGTGAVSYEMTDEVARQIDPEPRPDFNTEKYDAIDENPFKSVDADPISVFSVDVDNASYANVRRYLNSSQMPPEGAVRIEEMINYFPYSYPKPQGGCPVSIYTELGKCQWNPDHELLLVGLKAREIETANLPGSNLVFLLDVSGSMDEDNKLPLLARSFKLLSEGLRSCDVVSIVTYAGNSEVLLNPTRCDAEGKKKICDVLSSLRASGYTAGFDAIGKAYELAESNLIPGGNNRILLATDGDFNVGQSSNDALKKLVEQKSKSGIDITVLGFGIGNLNDSMMELISNCGNGNYFYIDTYSEAQRALGNGLYGTLFTVAKDVKVLVDFNPNIVRQYRLIGYENRMLSNEDFNNDKKDAGDMGSGHTVTALYELVTSSSKDVPGVSAVKSEYSQTVNGGDTKNYLTVKVRYKNPKDTVSQLLEKRVTKADMPGSPSGSMTLAENVALLGQLLRHSANIKSASYEQLMDGLSSIPSDDGGCIDELKVMARMANEMAGEQAAEEQ